MSYDIAFWKQERPLKLSPAEVYERLSKGDTVDALSPLPIDRILDRLKVEFPDFDRAEKFPLARTPSCSIEFSWSNFDVRFDIRGNPGVECQKLIDVMHEFGCPMYDSGEDKRYDKEKGMKVGKTPRFEAPSAKFNAVMEMIRKGQADGSILLPKLPNGERLKPSVQPKSD